MTSKADAPTANEDLTQDRRADLTAEELAAITEAEKEEAAELKANTEDAAKIEAEAAGADEAAAKTKAEADEKAKTDADAKAKADADAKAAADAAAKAKDEAEGKTADAAAAETETETEAEAEQPRAPRQAIPDWQAPKDAAAKIAEIAAARDALAEKFDAGELTAKDLLAQTRTLDSQERQIERASDRAEMATEMVQAVWVQSTVPAFLNANAHYRDNPTLHGMLDTEVRRMQVAASQAGKDPLDPSILTEADKAIKASLAALGVAPAETDKAKTDDPEKPAGGKKPTASAKPLIPPTLGAVPAADITGTDGKYAALDRLADNDPVAYEDAMAKLSETERNAYLNAG